MQAGKASLHRWLWVHKWSSLICTLFLLVICLTGLPLVFNEEIEHALDDARPSASLPADAPQASFERFAATSRGMYPGEVIVSIFVDDDEPKAVVYMAPSWQAFNANPKVAHWIRFDARTAEVLKQSQPLTQERATFLGIMLNLHKDLFAGLAGELFMGLMAVLFVVAVLSGAVVYGPFMRKLDFGAVRRNRSPRLKWLDLHNMIGVVMLAWTLVVGVTGVINELSTPLFTLWQETDVKAMLASHAGKPALAEAELSSVEEARKKAQSAVPDMAVMSVIFPGADFGTPYHYLFWAKGRTQLTSRLFSPILVDAASGELQGIVVMPWYLRALELARPLHFGDYGGLPLKIIWVMLDLVTITVLGSGAYLWLSRRASPSSDVKADPVGGRDPAREALVPEIAE